VQPAVPTKAESWCHPTWVAEPARSPEQACSSQRSSIAYRHLRPHRNAVIGLAVPSVQLSEMHGPPAHQRSEIWQDVVVQRVPAVLAITSPSFVLGCGQPSPGSTSMDAPKFDLGVSTDLTTSGGEAGSKEGCEKVDFLFVVDNSGSMGRHQAKLIESFGPFVETIYDRLPADDFRIMAVDSDAGDDIQSCEPCGPDSRFAATGAQPKQSRPGLRNDAGSWRGGPVQRLCQQYDLRRTRREALFDLGASQGRDQGE